VTELQNLTMRVTQLEIAVYRLITTAKAQGEALKAAASMPITCATCDEDITTKEFCGSQPCEWGFPTRDKV